MILLIFPYFSALTVLICHAEFHTCFVLIFQLEKAKKKEAAFIVTFAKREQEIAELKVTSFSCVFPRF